MSEPSGVKVFPLDPACEQYRRPTIARGHLIELHRVIQEFEAREKALFSPTFVGEIEIRTSFSYKSTRPPTFNLYRSGEMVACGVEGLPRAIAYAEAEAALTKGDRTSEGGP